jgi:hypothetical protein
VGTIRIVQADVGDHEIVQDFAAQYRLLDDPWHVLDLDAAIPDSLWVNYHCRAVFALLQAAGMIRARQRPESSGLELLLEGLSQCLIAVRITTPSLVPWRTHVATYKNMMGERRHGRPIKGSMAVQTRLNHD